MNENLKLRVSYKPEPGYKKVDDLEFLKQGDFVDLRVAADVRIKKGENALISLGVAIELPKGYYAIVTPRSSTYKKYGIIMTNSVGIIDESYNGDSDIWKFPALAVRDDVYIPYNERIAQFTIVKKPVFEIEKVDMLNNDNRGGFGSTGRF